jgi:hypothetical protein
VSDEDGLVVAPKRELDLERSELLRDNIHDHPILWSHPRMLGTKVAGALGSIGFAAWLVWWLEAGNLFLQVRAVLGGLAIGFFVAAFFARLKSKKILRGEAHEVGTLHLLPATTDGELIRLQGIARSIDGRTIPGFPGWLFIAEITPSKAHKESDLVVDRAVEFLIVGRDGASVLVEVSNARFLHGIDRVGDPTAVGVREGDVIEVIGRKGRRIDPRMQERLARDMPERMTIGESKGLPLLITPIGLASRFEEGKFASIVERQRQLQLKGKTEA